MRRGWVFHRQCWGRGLRCDTDPQKKKQPVFGLKGVNTGEKKWGEERKGKRMRICESTADSQKKSPSQCSAGRGNVTLSHKVRPKRPLQFPPSPKSGGGGGGRGQT